MSNPTQATASTTTQAVELFYFLVKILISSSGYEKEAVTVVRSANEEDAKTTALLGEAHNELMACSDDWFAENDYSFSYRVKSVVKLSEEDAAVFIKHNI